MRAARRSISSSGVSIRLTLPPAPGLDALIDRALRIDFTQSFQRKGRPGAIAQQALEALAVMRFGANALAPGYLRPKIIATAMLGAIFSITMWVSAQTY